MLDGLIAKLSGQCKDKVEILVDADNGEKTIGKKRNDLVASACGEYVVFVDDDDDVSDDYAPKILFALRTRPDCVGMEGIITIGGESSIFKHSIEYCGWYTGIDGYYRTPNHLNPIKRSIALAVGFPSSVQFGEDQRYSEAIIKHLKTEKYIEGPIYFYKCTKKLTAVRVPA
jgi:glycosyltransferase involved in cell wall biosynthesis